MNLTKTLILVALASSLVACGGGGGGGSKPASSSKVSSSLSNSVQISSSLSSVSSSVSSSASVSSSVSSSISSLVSSSISVSSSSSSSRSLSSSSTSASFSSINASISNFIVVDQFGYLPDAQKIAVIRGPQTGYDSAQSFTPGGNYQLVNLQTGQAVHTGTAVAWKAGATSTESGDKIWWFDFSNITTAGSYAVIDIEQNVRSPGFKIGADVYKPVLKHAVRTFFYQRAGIAKQQPYAEAGWTDNASHLGNCQDHQSRLFTDQGNAATQKDLRGGWFDAGDFNKYTNWHADYLIALLHAYLENPSAWTDDFNIPESNNGIPDIIDEIKWGMDWLVRMQNENGSVLSIQGLSHASPPSSATGCSYYGPASTSATLSSAAAFALGAKVLAGLGNETLTTYAADLQTRAVSAWTWANANPSVIVRNNEGIYDKLGAGQQEVDDAARALKKTRAAIYLYAATAGSGYHDHVKANYANSAQWVDMWNEERLMSWLYYANLPDTDATLASNIKSHYATAMTGSSNLGAVTAQTDGYRAYMGNSNFTWGSNRSMSRKGSSFINLLTYGAGNQNTASVRNAALGYLNYLHGTNPLGMVYLSNMYSLGVHSSVNEFYHSWYADGSPNWDRVGQASYGPAPGFLVGGPNPSYDWDNCCNTSCGSVENTNKCTSISLIPPKGQPAMKSYLDFNTSWPLNSWQITENHNDYQVAYIRLLSKFAN